MDKIYEEIETTLKKVAILAGAAIVVVIAILITFIQESDMKKLFICRRPRKVVGKLEAAVLKFERTKTTGDMHNMFDVAHEGAKR